MCMICGNPNCKGDADIENGDDSSVFLKQLTDSLFGEESPGFTQSLKERQTQIHQKLVNQLVNAENLVAELKIEKAKAVSAIALLEILSMASGKKINVTEIVESIWDVIITAIEEREKLAKQPTSTPIGDFQVGSSSVGQKN